ncbi:hypothetical protein MKA27_19440 [[Clostridium] innocuum]|uniref:hypothetical protein n=1 Tax=Clostridium innocuum TaxID=1522 RepID=UPI000D7B727C|nr:hypothetical protein [[Clostridium] innocuum]MCR0315610.1 hypothetical protein [[Clostridium] innocuum]MCR0371673.1 hypothetical protein [[Clostridium] innocuum]MCR0375964.1 hypothetical protein [[Clostridium] innocuum]MCR0561804.1 hypothetical protein [[Clostridium] innocuum]MCR0604244.1 hypothetical protein [[Clostridium] innocuum]
MESEKTLDAKDLIYMNFIKQGIFGCFEVTIGWNGKERVDFMTYDTKGIWRCYEIKVSKADFCSNCHKTFIGHYNYYVMPVELYKSIAGLIEDDIGVYLLYNDSLSLCKRARKRKLGCDETILLNSMIRSLSRDALKEYKRRIKKRYSKEREDRIDVLKDDIRSLKHTCEFRDELIDRGKICKEKESRLKGRIERLNNEIENDIEKILKKMKSLNKELGSMKSILENLEK